MTAVRRWLALLLLLAIAVFGAPYGGDVDQAALAGSPAHAHSIADHGDGPCCLDQKNHNPDGICSSIGGCSLWIAAGPAPTFMQPGAAPVRLEPVAAHPGGGAFSHFHPPKLSARV